jgi:polysaccharide pyruvyl transferase WcaK-like protein
MRILVVHAWLKGNLGDVLQLSVLLTALRALKPRVLDLAGYPRRPADETGEVLQLADRWVPDAFPWYWGFAPRAVGRLVIEPWWRRRRERLFARYDAVVCAPGPYLAEYDPRAASALCDISTAARLGMPVVLASHSVGPLRKDGIDAVARASIRIAREEASHRYLCERGVAAVLSADLAFVYPYRSSGQPAPLAGPYRVAFLRSNNLAAARLRVTPGGLFEGTRPVVETAGERLVLATSDYRRDRGFLDPVARRLGIPWVGCRSVPEMVTLIEGSSGVVSDRYHPAICAAVLGRPAHVLENREPHKMRGLSQLLAGRTLAELQGLARAGLRTVQEALGAPA